MPFATFMRGRTRVNSVILYSLVNVLPKLTSGLLAVLYTRRFSTEEYGNYGIFAAVIYLLAAVIDCGFASAALRNFYADKNRSLAYLSSVIYTARVVTLALLPVVGAILYFFWDQLGVRFTQAWIFVPALLLIAYFGRAVDMLATICRAIERPGYFAAGQIAQALTMTLAGLVLVFVLRLGIGGALLAMLIGYGAALLTYEALLLNVFGIRRARFDWMTTKTSLAFGLPLVPDQIASWARMLALRPTLAHLVALSDVGLFSFASALAALPNLLSSAIDLALAPIYFRRRESSEPAEFHSKMLAFGTIYAASMMPIWMFAVLFCPEIVRLVAGTPYVGAAPICAVLLCATFARFQIPFLQRQIHFMRKTWLQSAITIPWSVAAILLTIVFAARYGILAAAWTTLATELGILVSTAWAIRRHEQVGYPMLTGLSFIAFLALLAAWIAMGHAQTNWPTILLKLAFVMLATALSLAIWIWPKRRLVLQLASS